MHVKHSIVIILKILNLLQNDVKKFNPCLLDTRKIKMTEFELLQYAPFASGLDAGFWFKLSKKKLEDFKLDDTAVCIHAFYSNSTAIGLPPIANIDYSAFDNDFQVPPNSFPLNGYLINTNTLDDFKMKDKKVLLQSFGAKIWDAIKNGDALNTPSTLQTLLCFTFADLKKYHYYYWAAFPAVIYPEVKLIGKTQKFTKYFTSEQVSQFLDAYDNLCTDDKIAFLVHISKEGNCCISKLQEYDAIKNASDKVMLGFADPSTYENHPGWPLRNILALASYHWGQKQATWDVICFREYTKERKRHFEHSIVVPVELTAVDIPNECPNVVGWEKNQNKLAPRKVDMSANMDPVRLADSAVDLNLKLMRWRLIPELQLDDIKSSKCLLFGAGTLGCNVARCLLGWGIRKITFVDNASVSYSNPVRQTLFNFDDCLKGGKKKAVAAADALKKIFPGVDSSSVVLSVPMPGHAISQNIIEQVQSDVKCIEELISSHDVIFLLMDTRESRWLPSLIGAYKRKIVLNAALGFDTFLVMRHGTKTEPSEVIGDHSSKIIDGCDLGCYFCNDIVAPGNSTYDRTLDQQCTVTRPGVSYMAAALVVELMVSILQHPKRSIAPASMMGADDPSPELSTELGIIPHQIRGHLDRFHNSVLSCKAFDRCTACSDRVLQKYHEDGFDFLLKVFNDPNYLEDVTGLTDLMKNTNLEEVFELSDDESI